MRALGVRASAIDALTWSADTDPSWRTFAMLDAAVRMVRALVDGRAITRGSAASELLEALCGTGLDAPTARMEQRIPARFWWIRAHPSERDKLLVNGAVIVHFARREGPEAAPTAAPDAARALTLPQRGAGHRLATRLLLPPEAASALTREKPAPMQLLFAVLRAGQPRTLALVLAGLTVGAAAAVGEIMLVRALLTIGTSLALDYQRATAIVALLAFLIAACWTDLRVTSTLKRLGVDLEARLRVALLAKLPLLDDSYLRTRPASDMAARAHALHHLREVPALWAQSVRASLGLVSTGAGLIWLYPEATSHIVGLLAVALVTPYLGRRSLSEANVRLQTQAGARERFYLDALLGAVPIRVHGAAQAVQRGHELLLVDWLRSARGVLALATSVQGVQLFASSALALSVVGLYLLTGSEPSAALLLAFWALRMPALGQELVAAQLALRSYHGVALRLLAPLSAATERTSVRDPDQDPPAPRTAMSLALRSVSVTLGGRPVLSDLSVEIAAGEHVAIVGPSGAGKSSLIALLLGWVEASEGQLLVDGRALEPSRLCAETAWVDPAVQLWDASLYDNLLYGDDREPTRDLPGVLAAAELLDVVANLEGGLSASLGAGGARLSGGQAQRVRLGRALMREDARLVLLDEPFRGLERAVRGLLLARLRARFRGATLLFVSHDIADTASFDRVLVLARGRIVETGVPAQLARDPTTRYAQLVAAEQALRNRVFARAAWRRMWLERGALRERGTP